MIDLEQILRQIKPYVLGWVRQVLIQDKIAGPVYLSSPLVSTAWDGDSYSTTAKTLIDLSAVFGVPAGVKAVLVKTRVNDSGSAAGSTYLILSPNNKPSTGPYVDKCSGFSNDYIHHQNGLVPCDSNGDIYFQIAASGVGTFDVYFEIWGYIP